MDKMNLFGGNAGAKSSEASFEGNDKSSEVSPNPIQDENGILRFRLNISEITPVSSNHVTTRNIDDDGCFNLKGCICALNVNSEEEREKVKEEVNAITLAKYDWFKETTGDRHWVLYNTKMYEVKDSYLHYKESSDLAPELPINATSCYSMFAHCENLWTLDLSSFSTALVKNFSYMFSGCENLYHIDVSDKWNTNAAITADNVFEDCYRLPHYRDGRTGLEMCCSVNEGGYFHYVGEEDDYE